MRPTSRRCLVLVAGTRRTGFAGAAARNSDADMGFAVTFTLPFDRRDVWRELMSTTRQLGVDPSVTTTCLEMGTVQPGSSTLPGEHPDGSSLPVGLVRLVSVPGEGSITFKLIECNAERGSIVWELLAQHDCRFTLLAGSRDPITTTIRLEHMHAYDLALSPARPVGTEVTLTYGCAGIRGPGCLGGCFAGVEMNESLALLESEWHRDMLERGYIPLPSR